MQGFEQIKWKRRKAWQKIVTKWTEYITKMELWRNSLKKIEGNFGTGVVAYFQFLRWLMFLNLLIFSIIFAFIILPQLILVEPRDIPCDLKAPLVTIMVQVPSNDTTNQTSGYSEQEVILYPNTTTQCCTDSYLNVTKTLAKDFSILHIVQGTGFMEKTLLFYGMYTNQIYGYNPR